MNTETLLENSKTIEHKGDGDTKCNWCTWNILVRIGKGTGRLKNKRTSRAHPDYSVRSYFLESWQF